MTVAIDASTPAKVTIASNSATGTTASFTTPANVMLVALLIANNNSITACTHTISGAGLTWTKRKESPAPVNASNAYAAVWTATSVSALTSQTVTDTKSQNATTGYEATLVVLVVTGAESSFTGATNSAANASGLPSVNLTPTAVGSLLVASAADWAAAGTAPSSYTPGSGESVLQSAQAWISGQYGGAIFRQDALTPNTSAATLNLTAPAAENYQIVAAEVKAAPSTATYVPVVISQSMGIF